MNREELEKELDDWLDRAAAEYGRAETRSGFESRVIVSLNGRLEKTKWYFRWIPVAAAAITLLVFSIFWVRSEFQGRGKTQIASGKPIEVRSMQEQASNKERPGIAAVPAAKKPPRLQLSDQPAGRFLSSGLSDQERYLVAFATAASKQDIPIISEDAGFEPLQIPTTEIPAFTIPKFQISSFKTEPLYTQTSGSEDEL